jgi:hypothetical protein
MKGKQTLERTNSNVRSNYEPQRLIHDVNKFINIKKITIQIRRPKVLCCVFHYVTWESKAS